MNPREKKRTLPNWTVIQWTKATWLIKYIICQSFREGEVWWGRELYWIHCKWILWILVVYFLFAILECRIKMSRTYSLSLCFIRNREIWFWVYPVFTLSPPFFWTEIEIWKVRNTMLWKNVRDRQKKTENGRERQKYWKTERQKVRDKDRGILFWLWRTFSFEFGFPIYLPTLHLPTIIFIESTSLTIHSCSLHSSRFFLLLLETFLY